MLALLVLHRAKLLASNQSILALGVAPRRVAGTPVPVFPPGTDAGRVCQKALHDAEPTKHTQPFTTGKGFWVSARMPRWNAQRLCRTQSPHSVLIGIENSHYLIKNRLFLQTEKSLALRQDSFVFLP